jgi:hypothetical protein
MDVYKYLVFPQKYLTDLKMEYWLKVNVFSVRWWLILFFLIAPWIIWRRMVDKRRIKEIALHGFFIIIFSSLLDSIGSQLNLWVYPYMFTPLSQIFEPYDYSVLPASYMLIYQNYSNWKSFIKVQYIVSAIFSFILEPLTIYFNIYSMINWRYEYSFLIYPIIGMSCKIISHKINRIEDSKNGAG